jgi:type I restriction enzyme, S subunit
MVNLITEHMDIWTAAQTQKANGGRGRGKNGNGQSPYGIKKLRELILELAVRGKLVPQDPNDEPANELLKKIAREKSRLIKTGKIKKQKSLPEIGDDEKPFELLDGWEWTRLGDVTNYGISEKAEPNDIDENTWILELADVEKETSKLLQKVRFAGREFRSSKSRFSEGDVIYGKLRPYLDKVIVADESGVCTTEMIPLRGYNNIIPPYLRLVMKSPYFIRHANESTHGMNLPRMGTEKARMALFPMVSESEQHLIVAKVDELMALCDQLEQQQTDSNATHQTLVETLLTTLTHAADQRKFAQAWERIANHFDTLFTTEQSIAQLKQTILQLAVMGKLVPQDPNDEPVSGLLKKIAKEKARLVKEGKIKKQKSSPEIGESEKPFELPVGWKWSRLGDVTNYGISEKVEIEDVDENTWILELADIEKETSKLLQKVRFADREFRSSKSRFFEGDVIYGKLRPYLDKVIVADESGVCTTEMIPLRGYNNIIPQYLRLVMKSPYFIRYANESTHGMNLPRMGTDKARMALFPMVSESEQHLIVAKVDELMTLCDTLKARLNNAQTTQVHLADAIVEQAVT